MKKVISSLLLSCAVLVAAPAAEAQFSFKIPGVKLPGAFSPDEADRELRRINEILQKGFGALPSQYGRSADGELKSIASAEKHLADAKKAFGPTLRLGGANFGVVEKNIKDLTVAIENAKLAQACTAALLRITEQQGRLILATDAELKTFTDAIAAFKGKAGADDNIVKWYDGELVRVKKENAAVDEKAKKSMASRLSKEQEEKMKSVAQAANQTRGQLFKEMKANDIKDASLTSFENAIKAIRDINGDSAAFYETELSLFKIQRAWQESDGKAQDNIASVLGGTVVAKGQTKGKALDITVKPKGDHCYLLYMDYAERAGTEKIEKFEWSTKGARVQELSSHWGKDAGVEIMEGFCALGSTTVTGKADLVFAGSKNGVRYGVVEVPRKSFPMFIAARMSVSFPDPCDFDHWASYFTKPIPGTFAYNNGEPVIVTYSDDVGGNRDISYRTVANTDSRTKKSGLSTSSPDSVAFKSQFKWSGCWEQRAEADISKKIQACYDRIEARYEKDWDRVEQLREQAARHGAINLAAEDQADRLKDKFDVDASKECRPLEDKAEKEGEKSYNKLVDQLTDKKYKDPLARAEYNATEETAPFRRW